MSRGNEARELFCDHELKQSPRDREGIPREGVHLSATAKEFLERLKSQHKVPNVITTLFIIKESLKTYSGIYETQRAAALL